ncbi:MAG: acetyl-CoA carboxylase biotin carboxyl carrier protein [Candidatus Sumerlaeia bacterium]
MARKDKKNDSADMAQFPLNEVRELFQLVNRYGISEFSFKEGEREVHLVSGRNAPPQQTGAEDSGERRSQFQQYFPIISPIVGPHQQHVLHPQAASIPAEAQAPVPGAPGATGSPQGAEGAAPAKEKDKVRERCVAIKSPMVGTFYRSPSPDAPPYVEVGDEVNEDTVVCIIEAMKLFNEIKADVKGKVVEILVENAHPVEYDQEMFLIDPGG